MTSSGVILWDFDGTLGQRSGRWSHVLLEVLREQDPACALTVAELRPFLRTGFPWHRPDLSHTEITTPEAWWAPVERVLAQAYVGVGCAPAQAEHLAQLAHRRYIEASGWLLYEDALPTLASLRAAGWEHAILSNHVPELDRIVDPLGLRAYVKAVFNSAIIGYEKPHPQAFHAALDALGDPHPVWMVGDNVEADVLGAERLGIPAILVRGDDARAQRACASLSALPALLAATA